MELSSAVNNLYSDTIAEIDNLVMELAKLLKTRFSENCDRLVISYEEFKKLTCYLNYQFMINSEEYENNGNDIVENIIKRIRFI